MRFLCSSKHENLAVLSWILSIGSQTLSDVVRFIHTFRHISTLLPVRSTDRFLSVMSPLTGFTQKQREVSRFSLTLQRLMWHRPPSRGRVTPASRRSEPEVTPGRCCLNTNTPVGSDRHWEHCSLYCWLLRAESRCVCVRTWKQQIVWRRDVFKPQTRVSTAHMIDKHNPESLLSRVGCRGE